MEFTRSSAGGFIAGNESHFFTDIVRASYRGVGRIVDGGCFIGESTRALIAGIPAGALVSEVPPIIAIDRFLATDIYLVDFFSRRGHDVRQGECFLHLFLENIDPHLPMVEVRAGELQRVGRLSQDVEILVVDIAKSTGLNAFVVTSWLPKLIVGGHLIQQDFYAPSHCWIAASMGMLVDRFSISAGKVGESAAFRLEGALSSSDIQKAARVNPYSLEGLASIERMEQLLGPGSSLAIMRALVLKMLGRTSEARELVATLLAVEPNPADPKWRQWLGSAALATDPDLPKTIQTMAETYLANITTRSLRGSFT